jgi:GNAT superfamily N-acetyltransferase
VPDSRGRQTALHELRRRGIEISAAALTYFSPYPASKVKRFGEYRRNKHLISWGFFKVVAAGSTQDANALESLQRGPNFRNGRDLPSVRASSLRVFSSSLSVRGQGLGELLPQNAIKRALQARSTLGVHAVLVEAKNAAAEGFYRKYGFRLCDPKSRQLYLPLGAE